MANILVVVAHADDEALGCGATIAKHVANKDDVTLLVMTDGVSSRNADSSSQNSLFQNTLPQNNGQATLTNDDKVSQRQSALQQSCDILGIQTLIQCDFPDNKMDSVDLLSIVQQIEKRTENIDVDIIYTHSLYDLNIDHRLTAQAVLTAFRPLPESNVKTILSFEVLSSTEWQFAEQKFSANWFIDVTGFFQTKLSALSCYKEEVRNFPHPRSFIAVEAQAKLRGATIGKQYVEAFQVLRHQC